MNIQLTPKSLDVQAFTAIDVPSLHASGPVDGLRVNAQRAGFAIQVATIPTHFYLAISATGARDGLELQTNFATAVPISSGLEADHRDRRPVGDHLEVLAVVQSGAASCFLDELDREARPSLA